MNTHITNLATYLHQYTDLLADWHYTDENITTSPSHHCAPDGNTSITFHIDAPNYRGHITITYSPATLYTIRLTDSAITFYGIRDEEHILDVLKDFVENGEVYM